MNTNIDEFKVQDCVTKISDKSKKEAQKLIWGWIK